jgi:hypothetical protein
MNAAPVLVALLGSGLASRGAIKDVGVEVREAGGVGLGIGGLTVLSAGCAGIEYRLKTLAHRDDSALGTSDGRGVSDVEERVFQVFLLLRFR